MTDENNDHVAALADLEEVRKAVFGEFAYDFGDQNVYEDFATCSAFAEKMRKAIATLSTPAPSTHLVGSDADHIEKAWTELARLKGKLPHALGMVVEEALEQLVPVISRLRSQTKTALPVARMDVYSAIETERDYQDAMTARGDRPDMATHMPLSSILLAMERILHDARSQWYSDAQPYEQTMHSVRKIAGLAVKAGEQYGMPVRSPSPAPNVTVPEGWQIVPKRLTADMMEAACKGLDSTASMNAAYELALEAAPSPSPREGGG